MSICKLSSENRFNHHHRLRTNTQNEKNSIRNMDEDVERSSSCIIIFSIIIVIVIFNSAMESTLFSFTFVPFTVFDLRFNAKIPLLIRLDVSVSVLMLMDTRRFCFRGRTQRTKMNMRSFALVLPWIKHHDMHFSLH